MYAVFADRGKQVCVQPGETVLIDLHSAEAGAQIEFDQVLLIGGDGASVTVGKPVVEGAKVVVDVLDHVRNKKIHVQVYKRRKNYRKQRGHRQQMTQVRVKEIITG